MITFRRKDEKENKFQYLGTMYDICYTNERKIVLGNEKAFIGKNLNLDNWYKNHAKEIFQKYYDYCFQNFDEANKKPQLKIRKMKGKWGLCNITNYNITLNQELIKLNPKYLEYVLPYIYQLWGRSVHLETYVEGKPMVYSYDGKKNFKSINSSIIVSIINNA